MFEQSRRGFITGLISFAATAPAIVRATSLMPVKNWRDVARCATVEFTDIEPVIFQDRLYWVSGPQTISWGSETVFHTFNAALGKWEVHS
jgi:hypothetical protein